MSEYINGILFSGTVWIRSIDTPEIEYLKFKIQLLELLLSSVNLNSGKNGEFDKWQNIISNNYNDYKNIIEVKKGL